MISLQRSWHVEPFGRAEVATLSRLVPHLRRAGRLALLTGPARAQGMLDGFALLDVPAFLVGQGGILSRLNGPAERLLGRGLDVAKRRLVTPLPSTIAELHRLAATLAADTPVWDADRPGPVRVFRPGGHGLLVHGVPLPASVRDVFGTARAVLLAVDLDAGRRRAARELVRVYGLTRAEAEVAAALADGLDFPAIAVRRGVGVETVRSQARSMGSKMDARTRGAMVAIINRVLAHVPDTSSYT